MGCRPAIFNERWVGAVYAASSGAISSGLTGSRPNFASALSAAGRGGGDDDQLMPWTDVLLATQCTGHYVGHMIQSGSMTAEELLHLRLPDKRTELVKGVLVVRDPAGYLHGEIAAALAYRLTHHVQGNNLGRVLAAETGFMLTRDPDTVRAPDIAFIREERLPDPPPAGYAELAPDLVVEVLSPDDRPGEVVAKVGDWLEAGVRLVWVVDPKRRLARVYRTDGSETILSDDSTLSGEDVVPGFSCPLEAIL